MRSETLDLAPDTGTRDLVEVPDEQVQPVIDALHRLTGISIPVSKKTMVLFRLRKRLAELNRPSLPEYLAKLREDRREQQIFINLLTTNETSFFRTRRVWEFFQNDLLPRFHAEHGSRLFRAWSAAASTGEEACSIAMSCIDFQLRHPGFRFQVAATDVDTEVLAAAESGLFRATTALRLKESHPALFQRHFSLEADGRYAVDLKVRRGIRFSVHNLMSSPRALMPQDAVFLRNVLIYFRENEQKRIIGGIAESMTPGSILILGESETMTGSSASLFSFVQPQVYRRNAS